MSETAFGIPDNFSYPPGTALLNFQHNAAPPTVAETTLDFEDTATVSWTLLDDPANTRVKVSASLVLGAYVASFNGRTGAVVPAAGDYTAAQVTNAADKASGSAQVFNGSVSTGPTVVTAGGGGTAGVIVQGSAPGRIGLFAIANDLPLRVSLTSDSQYRYTMDNNGRESWGPGGATAPDTTLERSAVNTLRATNTGLLSTSPSVGLGYGAGAGGAVTQITSLSTGVTLSKVSGQITTFTAALAGGLVTSFVVTNTTVASTDTINVCWQSSTTAGIPIYVSAVANGSFTICYVNSSGALTSSAARVINFAVIKAVAA